MAIVMFLFMRYGSAWFFKWFLDHSPAVYEQCLAYINYRSYGIFFSYAGVALVSLYTGIARPMFILVDTIILAIVNLVLNYGLIFGKFGLPEMGIGGSGLASSIAEGIAFVIFVLYIILDKKNRSLKIFSLPEADWALTYQQLRLSMPVVAQAAVGQGSWVFFFGMVENLGERPLAISNLVRTVYLLLSIPLWGFSAGANTMISNLIGQNRHRDVLPATLKTGQLCFAFTLLLSIPVLVQPGVFLYPLLGKSDMSILTEAQPIFYVLIGLLSLSTFGAVAFNALAGTGATWFGLKMQIACIAVYLGYVFYVTNYTQLSLAWVWMAEVFYWCLMLGLSVWYLRSYQWRRLTI
jgi:Na+-driven multidrug efflux pump